MTIENKFDNMDYKEVINNICDTILTEEYYTIKKQAEKAANELDSLAKIDMQSNQVAYMRSEFEHHYAQLQECAYIISKLRALAK